MYFNILTISPFHLYLFFFQDLGENGAVEAQSAIDRDDEDADVFYHMSFKI